MDEKRCAGPCGLAYPIDFFARKGSRNSNSRVESRCLACKQTARTDSKAGVGRYKTKARACIRSHTRRWNVRHPDEQLTDSTFAARFDWDVDQMAHDIEHAASNGCPRCRRSFASMANGLRDITLDVIDPRQLPYYRTNCRWICDTCNKAAGDLTPEEDGLRLACWAKWEERMAELRADPWLGTLFEGIQQHGDAA